MKGIGNPLLESSALPYLPTLYRSPCVYAVHLKAEADVYIPSQLIDS